MEQNTKPKIAVVGPGAMGLLFAGRLSTHADVILLGNNPERISELQLNGVQIREGESLLECRPSALLNGTCTEPMDLVLLFTKAYLTEQALAANRSVIGENTYVLTLQNGMGHADVLSKFADSSHILIGTTEEGSSRENAYTVNHTGRGKTTFGFVASVSDAAKQDAERLAALFDASGFPCTVSDDISFAVWNKLMINASSSVLCGVLQKPQGYIVENASAWEICKSLITEVCETANAEGYHFDQDEQIDRLHNHLRNAPNGFPSLAADLKNGRKTEVDFISGSVVRAAEKKGLQVPYETLMVQLVHALEQ